MTILDKLELGLKTGKERDVLIEAINAFKLGYLPNETTNGKLKAKPSGLAIVRDIDDILVQCESTQISLGHKMVMIDDVPDPAVSILKKGKEVFRMGWSEVEQVYGRTINDIDNLLLLGIAIYVNNE